MRRPHMMSWRDTVSSPLLPILEASSEDLRISLHLSTQTIGEDIYPALPEPRHTNIMDRQRPVPKDYGGSSLALNRTSRFSMADSTFADDISIAESAMPPPLEPGRKSRQALYPPLQEAVIHRPRPTPWEVPASSTHPYGGSIDKVRQQLGVEEIDVNHYYLDDDPGLVPQVQPPAKMFRSSIKRLSLTPSDLQYPMGLLTARQPQDYPKVEAMLGLRRQSRPPPVPPKVPFSPNTCSSLPFAKEVSATLEPQNGRTAWLHALTAIFIVFNCWGMANAFGLFQAYYETYYLPGNSPSAIAWIGSTQLALVFGLGVPVGRLVDRGYFRLMFHTGSLVMVLGIFCTAWAHQLWSLWLVQGLLTGLGMGMVFCSGIVALMTWFDETKIGIAMGLGAAGSCIGGIVYVLLARHFLVTDDFPTTMRIIGGVVAITMIPPNLVFRMRGHGNAPLSNQRRSRAIPRLSVDGMGLRAFMAPSYVLAAGGMFFAFLGLYFGFVYMVSFASTVLRLSNTASTNLLIFMLVANLPGRFLPALISDRCIGPLNTIIPSIFLSAAVIGLWIASGDDNRGALTVIACFYGFVSAGIQVLYAPAVYTFCLEPAAETESLSTGEPARLPMERMGLKAGIIFSCVGVACLVGTPIGGALISYRTERGLSKPYLGAQVFAAGSLLLGGVLLLASRVTRVGWQARRA